MKCISPIGLSVTTRLAPKAFAQMLSMWFLADAAGQAVNSRAVLHREMKYLLWNYWFGSNSS